MADTSRTDNAHGGPQRHRLLIPQLPHPPLRLPPPACLFAATPEPDFSHRDLDSHQLLVGPLSSVRPPLLLFDNQLRRFEALLPLRIIFTRLRYGVFLPSRVLASRSARMSLTMADRDGPGFVVSTLEDEVMARNKLDSR
jgi:hypothetical protein